jgi:ubiquinone biosynthesis monooxygenase Coq7
MNAESMSIPSFQDLPLTPQLVAELRSDHAGETGAVAIYRGLLAVSRDPEVRRFALCHIRAELRHLRFFDAWLPADKHSRLLPVWYAAGWTLGAFSGLLGRRTVFRTVAAVETFVEKHYLAQIEIMASTPGLESLVSRLRQFCEDEVHHRDDAAERLVESSGRLARGWSQLIASGSALGVRVARRI